MCPGGPVVSTFCSWLVLADGVVGLGRAGRSFSGGGGHLRPGGFPGPVDWQVQHELAGGAGEPAGDVISCARMVPVVALAWKAEARTPAVRVRLKAIAAQTAQALFAANDPDGRCAKGPFFRSAMTCSTMAWARWAFSASSIGSGLLVNTA